MSEDIKPLDLPALLATLDEARHRDSLMADWARKWGRRLIEEVERMRNPGVEPRR